MPDRDPLRDPRERDVVRWRDGRIVEVRQRTVGGAYVSKPGARDAWFVAIDAWRSRADGGEVLVRAEGPEEAG